MATPEWFPISRNYEIERTKRALKSSAVDVHPLLPSRPKSAPTTKSNAIKSSAKTTKIKESVSDPLSDPLSGGDSSSSVQTMVDPLSAGVAEDAAPVFADPLLNSSTAGGGNAVIDDPLSNANSKSKISAQRIENIEETRKTARELQQADLNTPWAVWKQQLLKDYAIAGNITLSSSSFNEFEGSGVEDGSGAARHLDKYSARLAALEKRPVTEERKMEMTQKEYAQHVSSLSSDLDMAWAKDERVGSLKIAIKLAKLLADTTVPQFYPSMIVMVTEALDRFGDMVFRRLRNRADEALANEDGSGNNIGSKQKVLNDNFEAADVPSLARETCRNWFYKVACIRELLPRIYVELALFRCYRFLTSTDYLPILSRIGSIIRGIGDPLVSLYARTYLVVVAGNVVPHLTAPAQTMLSDALVTMSAIREGTEDDPAGSADSGGGVGAQGQSPKSSSQNLAALNSASTSSRGHLLRELKRKNIPLSAYLHLMSPGLEWIIRTVGRSASREVFQNILHLYREHCNESVVLRHILDYFDGSFFAHAALGMASLIKSARPSSPSSSLAQCYTSLGKQMSLHPPPEEQRLPLLNEVWKVVTKSTISADGTSNDIIGYVKCSYAWLDLVQKYYSEREMYVLLGNLSVRLQETYGGGDSVRNVSGASAGNSTIVAEVQVPETVLLQLEHLISSLIGQSSTFGTAVLTSEHLLKILDIFKGPKKVALCKDILDSFRAQSVTSDAVLINTLFDLCRVVHDSVDCLSPVADINYVSKLLGGFIDRIDFGRDLEQQLNFFVECRAVFCNLDSIRDKLVVAVSSLCMRTYRIVKGKHSKKTSTFVKACLAYCHITIPSLAQPFRRLELLKLCAEIALLNRCLPQTDAFLKAAITTLPELPSHYEVENKRTHYEEKLAAYLLSLLSLLVVTPGHPEHGPFYIVQGLINAIPKFPWQPATGAQSRVYCAMLALMCTYAQRTFPYHIGGVQSNDELYGGAGEYMAELGENINSCIADVLKHMTGLGEASDATAKLSQARAAIDLVNQLSARMALTNAVAGFSIKLLELAAKQKGSFTRNDQRYFANTVEFVLRQVGLNDSTSSSSASRSVAGSGVDPLSATAAAETTKSLKALL